MLNMGDLQSKGDLPFADQILPGHFPANLVVIHSGGETFLHQLDRTDAG